MAIRAINPNERVRLCRPVLSAVATLAVTCGFATLARAQDTGGISSPLISRCAGKFGLDLRAGDQAFPLLSLDGVPWVNIERTEQSVAGSHIVTTVTGTGARLRRRGQNIGLRFKCLVDDKGEAVAFNSTDLLPERKEGLAPATLVRGAVFYRPKIPVQPGTELRVQLLDVARDPAGDILAEVVVRSAWVQPTPFVLRLPLETKLEDRKLVVAARLALGSTTLFRLREARSVSAQDLQKPLNLTLDAAIASSP